MWQWSLKYCQVCAWMMQGGGDCWLTDGGTTGWGWNLTRSWYECKCQWEWKQRYDYR